MNSKFSYMCRWSLQSICPCGGLYFQWTFTNVYLALVPLRVTEYFFCGGYCRRKEWNTFRWCHWVAALISLWIWFSCCRYLMQHGVVYLAACQESDAMTTCRSRLSFIVHSRTWLARCGHLVGRLIAHCCLQVKWTDCIHAVIYYYPNAWVIRGFRQQHRVEFNRGESGTLAVSILWEHARQLWRQPTDWMQRLRISCCES